MTIYKCDKCEREVDRQINESIRYEAENAHFSIELCNECDEELKVWLKVPPVRQTLDQQIKERMGGGT